MSGTERSGHRQLGNPARAALTGPHARFAERVGTALRYHPDVCPMAALPDDPTPGDWADAARLVGPGGSLFIPVVADAPPAEWQTTMRRPGVQMIDAGVSAEPDAEAVPLAAGDVPEMIDLVRRTRPGPFRPRTIEMGTYLGIRRGGRLVAMGGERLALPGYTEISAVCTDPAHRGEGLASRLVLALAHGIRQRGATPILHADATNVNAIRLYEQLGFEIRAEVLFQVMLAPS
ncbi:MULTISPECIES: GNAT family N-acetyltransferase [Gordonia]|uniref:GNAT family N-acetyltransferase n=1 Tax=Gordonia amicalis TaxID=89053 RepID=A0AAE4RBZ2_9ACTN|nr:MULTISPECIES: GNAT family N-acetyltransferase [Gordonia]ATD72807.1 GNAT family N-acetyltransferase [Gordonia sp. 1D]MBA5847219.1 GNAT family N-acetyltransferase [Gordonia amicalis]MCZ4580828.1 GNAT family N-acetyltransferase [Gordonia amicalis]MCZ4653993.1 GNAT family N-acetyltransferase [Gordonia amicalis]MDJ0455312.1 GNAT family N-acetyltransferase [Gordonia amicalis]